MFERVNAVLSKDRLRIIPDLAPDDRSQNFSKENEFEIIVTNRSEEFASFKVEIQALGIESRLEEDWYEVEPAICAKQPPGDRTEFHAVIKKPPFSICQTTIDLKIRVLSIEFADLFTEQRLSLIVDKPRRSLRTYLPNKELNIFPGESVKIPVLTYNLTQKSTAVTLCLSGLKSSWLKGGNQLEIRVEPGDSREDYFICQPPEDIRILSQSYDFALEARSKDSGYTPPIQRGIIKVMPRGSVDLSCAREQQTIPDKKEKFATYELEFKNQSNLSQKVEIEIAEKDIKNCGLELSESIEIGPGVADCIYLVAKKRRHWLGGDKSIPFKVFPRLSGSLDKNCITTRPNVQLLELKVRPVIPVWLQYLGGIAGLLLIWLAWLLDPAGHHQAAVNSIRIIGNGGTVVSGGSDRTIRRWQVNSSKWNYFTRRLNFEGSIAKDTDRPVRVVRQSTKDDDVIAAGLDSGNIGIWNILTKQQTSIHQGSDRVFDLDFTRDARFLFSVHGSGFIYKWNLNSQNNRPENRAYPEVALDALAISEVQNQPTLIFVAGRYGKFAIWDEKAKNFYDVKYKLATEDSFQPLLGQYHYIDSLAIANQRNILAMADNQGYITMWNLTQIRQCIATAKKGGKGNQAANVAADGRILFEKVLKCDSAIVDRWREGHSGTPIHSVALTQNGCYLSSVGDDGRVMLWPLDAKGRRSPGMAEGKIVASFSENTVLKAVDIKAIGEFILIASDGKNNRMSLYRIERMNVNAECH